MLTTNLKYIDLAHLIGEEKAKSCLMVLEAAVLVEGIAYQTGLPLEQRYDRVVHYINSISDKGIETVSNNIFETLFHR